MSSPALYCHPHGEWLPRECFAERDVSQGRRLCRACQRERMKAYRRRFPEKVAWHHLLCSVRRKLGHAAVQRWHWQPHGQALVERLSAHVHDWTRWSLQWTKRSSATHFDLADVVAVE